jgi:hypothetical protein
MVQATGRSRVPARLISRGALAPGFCESRVHAPQSLSRLGETRPLVCVPAGRGENGPAIYKIMQLRARATPFVAPEGPRHVARAVRPWLRTVVKHRKPRRGDIAGAGKRDAAPLGLQGASSTCDQGLTPLATRLGPSGAR